jgi:hypothetical protein
MPEFEDLAYWTLQSGLNGFTAEEVSRLHGPLSRFVDNLA